MESEPIAPLPPPYSPPSAPRATPGAAPQWAPGWTPVDAQPPPLRNGSGTSTGKVLLIVAGVCAVPLLVIGALVAVITVLGEPSSQQFTDVGRPIAAPVDGTGDSPSDERLLDGEVLAWSTVVLADGTKVDVPGAPVQSDQPVDGAGVVVDSTAGVEHERFRVAVTVGRPGAVGIPEDPTRQLSLEEWELIAAEQGLDDPDLGVQRVVDARSLDVELLGTFDGVPAITHIHRSVVDGVVREIVLTGPLGADDTLRAMQRRVQESIVAVG